MNFGRAGCPSIPLYGQRKIDHVEHNLLSPVVQFSSKCRWQHDLPFWTTPAGVDPLKGASNLELFFCYLQLADDLGRNQIQPGPIVNQHLCDHEVADRW